VVIVLVVIPDGLPLAYEVMAGNTQDKTTLRDVLQRIETQFGKIRRSWVMYRGVPAEEVPAEMRASQTPMYYLVGRAGRTAGHDGAECAVATVSSGGGRGSAMAPG
jgi:hypothetical protein